MGAYCPPKCCNSGVHVPSSFHFWNPRSMRVPLAYHTCSIRVPLAYPALTRRLHKGGRAAFKGGWAAEGCPPTFVEAAEGRLPQGWVCEGGVITRMERGGWYANGTWKERANSHHFERQMSSHDYHSKFPIQTEALI
jgi:hypothetical protein